jgi:hypothetical protein
MQKNRQLGLDAGGWAAPVVVFGHVPHLQESP